MGAFTRLSPCGGCTLHAAAPRRTLGSSLARTCLTKGSGGCAERIHFSTPECGSSGRLPNRRHSASISASGAVWKSSAGARACGVRHLAPVGQLRIAIVTDPLAGPGRRGPAQPRAGVEGGRSWARSAAIDGALLHPAAPKRRSPRRSAFSGISQLPRLTPWSTTALPSAITHCVPWVRTIGSGPVAWAGIRTPIDKAGRSAADRQALRRRAARSSRPVRGASAPCPLPVRNWPRNCCRPARGLRPGPVAARRQRSRRSSG